jgi:hypothetical protein
MRNSCIKHLFYFSFLLTASNTATAVILVPEYESLTITQYEDEVINLSQGSTLNILPGGSVNIGATQGDFGAINLFGGEIRNDLGSMQIHDNVLFNMTAGLLASFNVNAGGNCTAIVSGGTADDFHGTCNSYISGGVFNGVVGSEGGGNTSISGGIFNDILSTHDGGGLQISGGKFKVPQIEFTAGDGWLEFFGYDLSLSDPFNVADYSHERIVTGHLLDGRYIDMHILVEGFSPYAFDSIILHNADLTNPEKTVPEPSTFLLLGAGLIALGAKRSKKKD